MRCAYFVIATIFIVLCAMVLSACKAPNREPTDGDNKPSTGNNSAPSGASISLTLGTELYKNFILDNVYHSPDDGDIHFHVYFPDGYNQNEQYALYVSLPGYEGLYFQGVGANIRSEDFVFEAQKYNDKMIIVAPQLNDWGQTSARQAVALTEFMLDNYPIDRGKVFVNGYSGGGETLSLVLTIKPQLFTAALHVASVWDGELEPLVNAQTPVYFVIGE